MSAPDDQDVLPGLESENPNPDPLLTTEQAGAYLGFYGEYVRRAIDSGRHEWVDMNRHGSRRRIRARVSALEAFIEAGTHAVDIDELSDPVLSTLHAAAHLDTSKEFVRLKIAAGRVAAVRMGQPSKRTHNRVRLSELEAYIGASTTRAGSSEICVH